MNRGTSRDSLPAVQPWAAALVVALGALTAAGEAAAQPVYAGAATRTAALGGAAEKVSAALGKAAAGFGAVDLSAPSGKAEQTGKLEEIQRLLADARGRYLEGDFQEAVVQSAEAMKRFEDRFAYAPSTDAWAAYAEVQLVRALALRRLGKEKEADDAFERLAALLPDYVPDPGLAPPKVASRYQAVLKALQEKPKVAIDVASRPAGAEIVVDGRKVGAAPLVVPDLLPGVHFVGVSFGGALVTKRVVVLKGTEKVEADLGDPRAAAARQLVDAMANPIAEAGVVRLATSVADETVVALVEPDRDALLVLAGRVVGGKLAAVTAHRVPSTLEGVDEAMGTLAAASLTATSDGFSDGTTEGTGELRARFLAPSGAPPADEGGDATGALVVGALVGGGLLVVATGVVVGVVMWLNRPTNPGGTDVIIDGSRLP